MGGPFYGPVALKLFFDCVLTLTDRRVPLVFGGRSPCTDGKVVYIPSRGLLDGEGFRRICGIILHEVAHIWFGSNAFLERLLATFGIGDRDRARLCFNAVIDVADEHRMGLRTARAKVLFDELRRSALDRAQAAGTIPGRPPGSIDSLETFLVVAMLVAQSDPRSEIRKRLRGWRSLPGVGEAFRILSRAVEKCPHGGFSPVRSEKEWSRIGRLTRELFELAEEYFPTGHGPGGGSPSSPEATSTDAYETLVQPVRTRIVLDGYRGDRDGETEEEDGLEDQVTELVELVEEDNEGSIDEDDDAPWGPFATLDLPDLTWRVALAPGKVEYDEDLYLKVRPAFRASVRRLVLGVSGSLEHGHLHGTRLGALHRLYTDGRVFRRMRYEESTEAAVCILVDHSHSMRSALREVLPVGLAMAEALDELPDVTVSVIRFGSRVERLAAHGLLREGLLMGGTATHLALREARDWLAAREAPRKVAILFTDGIPDEGDETRQEALELRQAGAHLLVGTLGDGLEPCTQSFPHAVLFRVDPAQVVSSLHAAVGRLLGLLERRT
jgi:hypothetical protein